MSMLVMLSLVFGVIEVCWAVYAFHYLGNASHEAARYAIVRGGSWTGTCDGTGAAGSGYGSSQCQASSADVANFVASRNFPGINLTASDVCVAYYSSVPTNSSQDCIASAGSSVANSPGDIVQVTITYPFQLAIPGFGDRTWHMMSTSEMVIAQ